ncbi:MAG: hypothetical protein ACKVPJ_13660 [Chitinophagales bacterium]
MSSVKSELKQVDKIKLAAKNYIGLAIGNYCRENNLREEKVEKHIADSLHIKINLLYWWKNNSSQPSIFQALLIAEILDITLVDIFSLVSPEDV